MKLFDSILNAYQEMLDCPDPISLEDYRLGELSTEESDEIKTHLEQCAHCQLALQQLNNFESSTLVSEPTNLVSFVSQAELPSPVEFKAGQIWLSKAELDLNAFHLNAQKQVIVASLMRTFLILECGKKSFGNRDYQSLTVSPISEFIELATEHDYILSDQDSGFGVPMMIELWNSQQVLSLQLERCIGELSEHHLVAVQQMRKLILNQESLIGSGLPRGGQIQDQAGPHAKFQQREKEQGRYLHIPVEALASLESFSSQCFIEIARRQLSKKSEPGLCSPLIPPSIGQMKQKTVLAAASEDSSTQSEAQMFKDRLQLSEDIILEVWLESPHLEFFCHTLEGHEIEGLEVKWIDSNGNWHTLRSDEFGSLYLPLEQLMMGVNTLLYFSLDWQQTSIKYVYPLLLKDEPQA